MNEHEQTLHRRPNLQGNPLSLLLPLSSPFLLTPIPSRPVLVETIHLLFRRIGIFMTLAWFDTLLMQGFELFSLDARGLQRIQQLMHQYAVLPMDLADASLMPLAGTL